MKSSLIGRLQDAELAAFCCCEDGGPIWRREVEDYLRAAVLRRAQYVLGLRADDDRLIGVSAFDPREITGLPVQRPIKARGWRLLAVGICLEDQGSGHAQTLLNETLATMFEIDSSRSLITARAHPENTPSLRACEGVGIEAYAPTADGYLELIGSVPGTTPPDWFD